MDPISTLGAMTGIANTIGSLGDNERQQGYTLDMMNKQYELNKKALKDQEASQLRMFEATGYGARVTQMKKAGLNPGLIYSTGAGAGGVTGNISAPSTGLGQAPNVSANTANRTAALSMTLQMQKLQSEIDVNKSMAEANRAAATTQTAQVPKIEAETENLKKSFEMIGAQINSEQIKQIGWSLDNNQKKIDLEIAEKGKFANIQRIINMSEESHWDMLKAMEEAGSAKAKNTIDQATIDTTIKQYNANLKKTVIDIVVAKTAGAVNIEKATQIINEIEQKWGQLIINARDVDQEIWKTLENNGAAMDRTVVSGISSILGGMIRR